MTPIPRILHQIWLGPRPRPQALLDTWRAQNPSWEYILWDEERVCEAFPNGLRTQNLYDKHGQWPAKADLLRYEVLLRFGGVYVDADAICLRPLPEFLLEHDIFSCYDNELECPGLIANAFLGACPGNAFLRDLVEFLASSDAHTLAAQQAWISTGPVLFTERVKATRYRNICVFPSFFFIPRHSVGAAYTGPFRPVADHLWGSIQPVYAEFSDGIVQHPVLGTGCFHCGTGYSAALLQAAGRNVGHEVWTAAGMVSWMAVALRMNLAKKALFGDAPPEKCAPVHYIHVVRDPKKALASIRDDTNSDVWAYCTEVLNAAGSVDLAAYQAAPEMRAALYYIHWNHLVEASNPTTRWRVEDAPDILLQQIGLPALADPARLPSTTTNTRHTHAPFEFDRLTDVVKASLATQARRYGYEFAYLEK
jgi:hypothetical protein